MLPLYLRSPEHFFNRDLDCACPESDYENHTGGCECECECEEECDDDYCVDECGCEPCLAEKSACSPRLRLERPEGIRDIFESVYTNRIGPYRIAKDHQLDYQLCTARELKGFVDARGLQDLYPAGTTLKPLYIRALQDADRKATFRFLDLPAEMRNLVYAELLTFDVETCPHRRMCYAQILRTCKAAYVEAKEILYDNVVDVRFSAQVKPIEHAGGNDRLETGALVHNTLVTQRGKTDFGRLLNCTAIYPDFLKRITQLKLSRSLTDDPSANRLPEFAHRGLAYLHSCLVTLTSFLMDQHCLHSVQVDITKLGRLEDEELIATLRPLRRLRNVSSMRITGDCREELKARIANDVNGTASVPNTLKQMQLVISHGQAAVRLGGLTNPLFGHRPCGSYPSECGYEMVDLVQQHLDAILCGADDRYAHFGLFESARKEKILQIRLAKIQDALSDLHMDMVRKNLELLEKAKATKDEYFDGRVDPDETKLLAGYYTDYETDYDSEDSEW